MLRAVAVSIVGHVRRRGAAASSGRWRAAQRQQAWFTPGDTYYNSNVLRQAVVYLTSKTSVDTEVTVQELAEAQKLYETPVESCCRN